jgi:hypothetical protein
MSAPFTRFTVMHTGVGPAFGDPEWRVFEVTVLLPHEYPLGETQRRFIEDAIQAALASPGNVPDAGGQTSGAEDSMAIADRCSICKSKSHGTQAHKAADRASERAETMCLCGHEHGYHDEAVGCMAETARDETCKCRTFLPVTPSEQKELAEMEKRGVKWIQSQPVPDAVLALPAKYLEQQRLTANPVEAAAWKCAADWLAAALKGRRA